MICNGMAFNMYITWCHHQPLDSCVRCELNKTFEQHGLAMQRQQRYQVFYKCGNAWVFDSIRTLFEHKLQELYGDYEY